MKDSMGSERTFQDGDVSRGNSRESSGGAGRQSGGMKREKGFEWELRKVTDRGLVVGCELSRKAS